MNLRKLILTKNECYITGTKIKPCGVMVHSTAANNPWLKRYVGPDDGMLGVNQYGNHWNQFRPGGRQVCVHAFIGKLADGTIATYQTMPWDMEGWHAGGSANKIGYIGFEICEDNLTDPVYFAQVYREAVELTAYLCKEYGLDPMADGVVICHQEGYRRGIASNHGDVLHWFPKHGKSMDDFRRDVADEMEDTMTYDQFEEYMDQYLKERGMLPPPAWAVNTGEWSKATELCITDGSRPQDFPTRAEVAAMILRSQRK